MKRAFHEKPAQSFLSRNDTFLHFSALFSKLIIVNVSPRDGELCTSVHNSPRTLSVRLSSAVTCSRFEGPLKSEHLGRVRPE